jgi:hypothetical protein
MGPIRSERQARELTGLPVETQREVFAAAHEATEGPPRRRLGSGWSLGVNVKRSRSCIGGTATKDGGHEGSFLAPLPYLRPATLAYALSLG